MHHLLNNSTLWPCLLTPPCCPCLLTPTCCPFLLTPTCCPFLLTPPCSPLSGCCYPVQSRPVPCLTPMPGCVPVQFCDHCRAVQQTMHCDLDSGERYIQMLPNCTSNSLQPSPLQMSYLSLSPVVLTFALH